jgi:hypothetical protein
MSYNKRKEKLVLATGIRQNNTNPVDGVPLITQYLVAFG